MEISNLAKIKMSEEKSEIRHKIWTIMEKKGVARFPRPIKGRIPNFEGAEKAAENLKNFLVSQNGLKLASR
ncbi:hypothetical protein AKJ62_02060 [candidate division MSBL1 archaeon SCGC-AAA259D14]|uniref:5-formyltetrahydrofolate cyclo-ligase n=1 Tax=candidate division MSBL1 archaeon SCGC-AAA259D14 TaxID=1698261 RepID=A0A133U6W1_9EURY|nr:hypothetical protein AKJ62_02060 [candidate division MSBL1 archaeon SCGC-AAA259D14]